MWLLLKLSLSSLGHRWRLPIMVIPFGLHTKTIFDYERTCMKCYSRNVSCMLNSISTFLFQNGKKINLMLSLFDKTIFYTFAPSSIYFSIHRNHWRINLNKEIKKIILIKPFKDNCVEKNMVPGVSTQPILFIFKLAFMIICLQN
jgi:hypothetical protein